MTSHFKAMIIKDIAGRGDGMKRMAEDLDMMSGL